jgi:hypothetical protein
LFYNTIWKKILLPRLRRDIHTEIDIEHGIEHGIATPLEHGSLRVSGGQRQSKLPERDGFHTME